MSKNIRQITSSWSKEKQLEFALCVPISKDNIDYLKDYWKAFYEDPISFVDDDIINLITKDLFNIDVTISSYKDVCRILGRELQLFEFNYLLYGYNGFVHEPDKYSNLKDIILNTLSELHTIKEVKEEHTMFGNTVQTLFDVTHLDNAESLMWGSMIGTHVKAYAMAGVFRNPEFANGVKKIALEYERKNYSREDAFFIFNIKQDALIVPMYQIDLLLQSPVWDYVKQYTNDECYCSEDFYDNRDTMRDLAKIYCSFAPGPRESRIPVMWYSSAAEDDEYSDKTYEFEMDPNYVDQSFASEIYNRVRDDFPPVDLSDGISDNQRYTYIDVKIGQEHFIVGYNRNHKGYNGDISDVEKTACLQLFSICYALEYRAYDFNDVTDYMEGSSETWSMSKEDTSNSDEQVSDDEEPTADEPTKAPNPEVYRESLKFSDNPMLRAAQSVDTRYE